MSQQIPMRYLVGLFPGDIIETQLTPQLEQYEAHLRDTWGVKGQDGGKVAFIEAPENHSQELLKWLEGQGQRVEIFETEPTARNVAERMATGQT